MHVVILLSLSSLAEAGEPEQIVVANRGSSSLSVIDVATDQVVQTVVMPDGGEPTYLSHAPGDDRLFVADRANDRAVIFRVSDLSVEATVPAGRGVFHCWLDPSEEQAWITNDIDSTVTVIDTVDLDVITTIPMPADLVAAGYVPHDVNLGLEPGARYAFVTLVAPGSVGYVLKYSTRTFRELERREVGGDPHVSLPTFDPSRVYVMSQASGEVSVLRRRDLSDAVSPIPAPGAHGGVMNRGYDTSHFYTTNLPGGGVGGLITIDPDTYTVVAQTDTPHPTPHNLALAAGGTKLYVTHSGPTADQVTVYDLDPVTGVPTYAGEVTVGLNPFGLSLVPDEPRGDDDSSDDDSSDDDSSDDDSSDDDSSSGHGDDSSSDDDSSIDDDSSDDDSSGRCWDDDDSSGDRGWDDDDSSRCWDDDDSSRGRGRDHRSDDDSSERR